MTIVLIGLLAVLSFFFQKLLYQKIWNRSVLVKLEFADESVFAGGTTVLNETVENRKWLPLTVLKVKFQCSNSLIFETDDSSTVSDLYYRNDLFCLLPYRRIIRGHTIHCPKRGYYGINGIDLVGADLFLSTEMVENRLGEAYLHVLPAIWETDELITVVRKINGEIAARRHLVTDPFAFRGIREYTPFDEVKSINWKASAKTEELKVNVNDYTSVGAANLYLNLSDRQSIWQEDQLEKVISIGCYLVKALLEKGNNISLYTNGRDGMNSEIQGINAVGDSGQLEQIYRMMARIDLKQPPLPFEQHFKANLDGSSDRLAVIIASDYHEDFQTFLGQIKGGFIWICPCVKSGEVPIKEELVVHTILIPDQK
ncbi:MAG: DUF58 domain-containing protein [Lachnospiraceae bacterium]|jgi:hypothetical protein|nr:DUF58 domain-containing protein [Lachnospiraceae bacterium]